MEPILASLSSVFVPVLAAIIIAYGLYHRAPVYDYFIDGAKKGLITALEILPFLIGIYLAINGLTASGFLNFLFQVFRPFFNLLHIPLELLPLILLRAVSGSGSFLILQNILETTGPDTYVGRAACAMSGGCETVIYALALYFSVTKVSKTRHAFLGGILAYLTGIVAALIICRYI